VKKSNRNGLDKIEINISVEVGNKRKLTGIVSVLGIIAALIFTIPELIKMLN